MDNIRKLVPHFWEVKTDAISFADEFGLPSDLVPVMNTRFGATTKPIDGALIQPWVTCCSHNLWAPMDRATKELGATEIIRGQRGDDYQKAPIQDGDVIDGITYRFPLQDWSEEDVFDYLKSEGVEIPSYYEWSDTSLDCWHCTAFLGERRRELQNMKTVHPELWAEVKPRIDQIREVVDRERAHLEAL